jgi:carboxyl-terminal processing protease
MKRRKETKPLMVKSLKDRAFKGRIIVLVDSNSTSAAEALARVVQLEKRGIIIGDRTTGKVMRSIYYPLQTGIDRAVLFGVSITDADLIMSDGKSLEQIGVTPDEIVLPSPTDLATRRDPTLARAAEMAGVKIDPEKAGALFQ